jgi:hypothetical protein
VFGRVATVPPDVGSRNGLRWSDAHTLLVGRDFFTPERIVVSSAPPWWRVTVRNGRVRWARGDGGRRRYTVSVLRDLGFSTASPVFTATYSPSGRWLVVADRTKLTFFDTDTDTGARGAVLQREDFLGGWSLSPNERYAVVRDQAGNTAVFDVVTGRALWDHPVMGHTLVAVVVDDHARLSAMLDCNFVRFNHDGTRAWSASVGGVPAPGGLLVARVDADASIGVYRLRASTEVRQRSVSPWT